jgi:hypothetical protein
MAHAVHFSVVPNPYSFPCLCPVQRLSIVVPRSSKHSPELTSRKPLGILVSLLNATLIGLLASVASKGVSAMLKSFRCNTYKKPRGALVTVQADRAVASLPLGFATPPFVETRSWLCPSGALAQKGRRIQGTQCSHMGIDSRRSASPFDDPFSFHNSVNAVHAGHGEPFLRAARPVDFHFVHFCCGSQTKM